MRTGPERGSVTAELALGLPAVVVVLTAVLGLTAAATAQMRCSDAARAAARSLALGDDPGTVGSTVTRLAGGDATVTSTRDGEWVTVTVHAPVAGWLDALPLGASADAVARVEP